MYYYIYCLNEAYLCCCYTNLIDIHRTGRWNSLNYINVGFMKGFKWYFYDLNILVKAFQTKLNKLFSIIIFYLNLKLNKLTFLNLLKNKALYSKASPSHNFIFLIFFLLNKKKKDKKPTIRQRIFSTSQIHE